MDFVLIAQILTVVLAVLSLYFGDRLSRAKRFMKELGELITVTAQSIEDNKITEEELKQIIKELNDLISLFKDLGL